MKNTLKSALQKTLIYKLFYRFSYKHFLKNQLQNRLNFFERPFNVTTLENDEIVKTLDLLKVKNHEILLTRIGGDGDGGYVIPNDLSNISACFSPGVAESSNFELEMAEKGIISYLADASVDGPPVESIYFDFEKKFIGNREDPNWMTLQHWVEQKAPGKSNFILQMDIEGGEWEVLNSVSSDLLSKFAIIVIEFHDLHMIRTQLGNISIRNVLTKLDELFDLVFLTPNNAEFSLAIGDINLPPLLEATYVRKNWPVANKNSSDSAAKCYSKWTTGNNVPWLPSLELDSYFQTLN